MKTPRVHDFDPHAQVPELTSPLDDMPIIQKPSVATPPMKPERPNARTGQDLIAPTNERPNARRVIKRASYELYADQIEAVRRLSLEDKLQGGKGNQSEMVRNAIDEYLKRKERGK